MSLPLIQINGKCEVPIQIISLRVTTDAVFELFIYGMFF
jgi:hypothetical protein